MATIDPMFTHAPPASTPLRGISSMATRQVLAELVTAYEPRSGVSGAIESVGGVDAAKRVMADESLDLVVLASDAMHKLVAAGKLVPGSVVDLVHSGVAVAVKAGAPQPDLGSEAAGASAGSPGAGGLRLGQSGLHPEQGLVG